MLTQSDRRSRPGLPAPLGRAALVPRSRRQQRQPSTGHWRIQKAGQGRSTHATPAGGGPSRDRGAEKARGDGARRAHQRGRHAVCCSWRARWVVMVTRVATMTGDEQKQITIDLACACMYTLSACRGRGRGCPHPPHPPLHGGRGGGGGRALAGRRQGAARRGAGSAPPGA